MAMSQLSGKMLPADRVEHVVLMRAANRGHMTPGLAGSRQQPCRKCCKGVTELLQDTGH